MNKVIAMSLWGDNPMYSIGLLENLKLAPVIYPGWQVWVYHDATVAQTTLLSAQALGARTILVENPRGAWDGLFWRFYPASDTDVECLIVRDTDSRLNSREQAAVAEWLASDYRFHSMRDHWQHNVPIMGGMWGIRGGLLPQMQMMILKWKQCDNKGDDQLFLASEVWPLVKDCALAHDRYPCGMVKVPDGRDIPFDELVEYNPWDNCGDLKLPNYPNGRVVLKSGEVFQRLDCYVYDPKEFGFHTIKPFPPHPPMMMGTHVGEYFKTGVR